MFATFSARCGSSSVMIQPSVINAVATTIGDRRPEASGPAPLATVRLVQQAAVLRVHVADRLHRGVEPEDLANEALPQRAQLLPVEQEIEKRGESGGDHDEDPLQPDADKDGRGGLALARLVRAAREIEERRHVRGEEEDRAGRRQTIPSTSRKLRDSFRNGGIRRIQSIPAPPTQSRAARRRPPSLSATAMANTVTARPKPPIVSCLRKTLARAPTRTSMIAVSIQSAAPRCEPDGSRISLEVARIDQRGELEASDAIPTHASRSQRRDDESRRAVRDLEPAIREVDERPARRRHCTCIVDEGLVRGRLGEANWQALRTRC